MTPPPAFPATAPPRPPIEPHPLECCGRGCCPCIFDYYRDALSHWRIELSQWEAAQGLRLAQAAALEPQS